jgi:transcriptional regulator with XRE-family HTH domain
MATTAANRPHDEADLSRTRVIRRGPGRNVRLTLRGMRESSGKTQAQVAKKSGLAQPEISKLETATTLDERQLSTIRRYLAALGDELELVSVSKYGHRIGIAGASNEGHAAADESSPFKRLQEFVLEAKKVISEVEPFRTGINVDNGAGLLQEALGLVVDAAGVRWKESESWHKGQAAKRYALPAALLRLSADAFRNEGHQQKDGLANDIATLLRALTVAWEKDERDEIALRRPSAPGRRDAPLSWAARYEGRRPSLSRSKPKELLIESLKEHFATGRVGGIEVRAPSQVKRVIWLALLEDCIKDENNGFPSDLESKLAKYVERNGGWPEVVSDDYVIELVENLLRLATGERDPLNTIRKRQRRKDRSPV